MRISSYSSVSLFLLAFKATIAECRTWQSVINREIVISSVPDVARQQLKLEQDPFLVITDEQTGGAPSPAPQSNVWVTLTPTNTPSGVPSDMPSMYPTSPTSSPTEREKNVIGNGGCNQGAILYQVNMYDSWGDGWDNTLLSINGIEDAGPLLSHGNIATTTQTTDTGAAIVTYTETVELTGDSLFDETNATPIDPLGLVFQGGLRRGSHASADVCLMPRRCYEVIVHGGDFLSEVSWDIRPVVLGVDAVAQAATPPLLEGGAPSECQFSLPNGNFDGFCPSTCSNTLHPEHTQVPRLYENLHINTPSDLEQDGTDPPTIVLNQRPEFDSTYDARGVDFQNGKIFLEHLKNGRRDD